MLELLLPAGNLNKLKTALHFGADAVYFGGKSLSLRAFADNFTNEEIAEGIAYAHARSKKAYVAANILARNSDLPLAAEFFEFLQGAGADAVLVSDMGMLSLARRVAPNLAVHISTQASTANSEALRFFKDLGVKRVVLARELTIDEISELHADVPDMELEAFVHGAMCVSYSGRCLLSSYLAGRSGNRGECAQPCRWRYTLSEEGSPHGLVAEEDERGTYLFNSKDLCLLRRIPELARAGVCSLKVEGRMKSEFYIASVCLAYRQAIDEYLASGKIEDISRFSPLLEAVSHRPYTEAFADEKFPLDTISYDSTRTPETKKFTACVLDCGGGEVVVEMRNRFKSGDVLQVLSPTGSNGKSFSVGEMTLEADGSRVDDAKLVQAVYRFACPIPLERGDILLKEQGE